VEAMQESDLPANASWLVAPFLDQFPDATVVHLVRHPKRVLDSFRRIAFFNPRYRAAHQPQCKHAKEHCPGAWQYSTTKMRAGHFYVAWNRMIERLAPDAVFHRIEDRDEELLRKLGVEWKEELFSDTTYNHRDGPVISDVDTRKLWDPVKSDLAQMMDDYGYEYIAPQRG
jgi:hypothetical protein